MLTLMSFSIVPVKLVTTPEALTIVQQTSRVVKLHCAATGAPLPTVKWTKNGLPLTDEKIETRKTSIAVNSTLVLNRFVPGQSDNFSCEVRNTAVQHLIAEARVGKYKETTLKRT